MNRRIMIVDDEANVLRMLSFVLDAEGFGVITAETGEEALAKIRDDRPDLVILDNMLPGISGTEVCKELRADPETIDLPVMILSARAQVSDRISGIRAGADEYITKPFDCDEVVARVAGMLDRQAELLYRRTASEKPSRGTMVAVCGAKGGVGQTVMATNLAVALGRETKARVALVDANIQAGDVSAMLELYPKYTVLDLLARADDLDSELIDTVAVSHSSGIEVLAAPEHRIANDSTEAPPLMKMLTELRNIFDFVVVDSAPFPGKCCQAGLSVADRIVLLTTPEVTSVRRAQMFIEYVQSLQPEATPIAVLNCHGRKSELPSGDIEQAMGYKITAALPNDPALVSHSINEGVPFIISRHRSDVAKQVTKLAKLIAEGSGHKAAEGVAQHEVSCKG